MIRINRFEQEEIERELLIDWTIKLSHHCLDFPFSWRDCLRYGNVVSDRELEEAMRHISVTSWQYTLYNLFGDLNQGIRVPRSRIMILLKSMGRMSLEDAHTMIEACYENRCLKHHISKL